VGLASAHKKVLLLDLDPQGSAGIHLGVNGSENYNSTYNMLTGIHGKATGKIRVKGIDFIPSCKRLARFNFPFVFHFKKTGAGLDGSIAADMLKRSLDDLRNDYDFVFIDCPPSWNLITMNALVACTDVFIPLQTHFLALKGMNNLLENIRQSKGIYNININTVRILLCQYDTRCNLSKEITAMIKANFGGKMFNTIIRKNIALAESPMKGKDIFAYRHLSHGAEDYMNLVEEVILQYLDQNIPSKSHTPIQTDITYKDSIKVLFT
jgi:chromosome partitioning protein